MRSSPPTSAERLGFQRLGKSIRRRLKGHLRAAIRRKILDRRGDIIELETFRLDEYTTDELVTFIQSVMKRGHEYTRDETVAAVAEYVGFSRVTQTIRRAVESAIRTAGQYGVLRADGSRTWREE